MSYTNYYPSSEMFHASIPRIMGTRLDILLIGKEETELRHIWENMENTVVRLDRMLNRFDSLSDISQINQSAPICPVKPAKEIWDMINDCKKYYLLTKGYFDISLGNFNDIILNDNEKTLYFNKDSITLDLGGYAKGYVLNIFREILEKAGINCALINFGNSSVLALGSHPYGDYWPVGLNNPYSGNKIADLKLRDCSLSVSGNMPSHPKHIINPHNGKFVETKKLVAVECSNPIDAEVLTTTFMITENRDLENEILKEFEIKNIYSYNL
ncbi:MAG: FAD:protein FMN transferase [Parabacteroides sp.]|nr:FAD:protein FMN transferase [Parabacteroides sp.]